MNFSVDPTSAEYANKPFVDGKKILYGGVIHAWTGDVVEVTSPIVDRSTNNRTVIGELAQMHPEDVLKVVTATKVAWNGGQGVWPQMCPEAR